MRIFCLLLMIFVVFSAAPAQTREAAIETFNSLKQQPLTDASLEQAILAPAKEDLEAAARDGLNVFRILPREKYDRGIFTIRGGGSYYSFYFRIPDYGNSVDLGLEKDYFGVGFAGANHGFIKDLDEFSIDSVESNEAVPVLADYAIKKDIGSIYAEYQALHKGLDIQGISFRRKVPVVVGHTYIIRSVNYMYSDLLAAFKVHRKDTDGSLVIFWKLLRQFDTPLMDNQRREPLNVSDAQILEKTNNWFKQQNIFSGVRANVSGRVTTLTGTVAKKDLAYAVQLANSAGALKVVNALAVK
jgi:hypothetical protein